MESKILTVNTLLHVLNEISANGYGDLKIKCNDAFIYDNEIGVSPYRGELQLKGYLFNQPISEKVSRLKEDIEKAISRFYES